MLVLSRKSNQEIMIGDDIQITVLQVKGNTIRLGIQAPSDVRIMRGEIADASPKSKPTGTSIPKNLAFSVGSKADDKQEPNATSSDTRLPLPKIPLQKTKVQQSPLTVRFGKGNGEMDGRVETIDENSDPSNPPPATPKRSGIPMRGKTDELNMLNQVNDLTFEAN